MADRIGDLRSWKMEFDGLAERKGKDLDPPGYDAALTKDGVVATVTAKKKDSSMLSRKQAALFAKAQAPLKQVATMAFMAWMSGNSIQIFSILMTFNLVFPPLTAIIKSGEAFPRDEEWKQLDVITPRLLYCVIFFGQFVFGLYKLHSMGLLPVFPSDYISIMPVPVSLEHALAAVG